ncbi:MAG: cytochrome bc1 complex diheme cytochrome c subunit [Acidimicrobiales bacterium]
MADDLLHPLTASRPFRGPRLVVAAGFLTLAALVVFFATRGRASALPAGRPGNSLAAGIGAAPFTTDQVAAGGQLFAVHCSSCHGLKGAGTSNGPTLVGVGVASADFYLRTGRMPLNDPHAQATRHHPVFPPDQIQDLDAYVASLGPGTPIPTVLPGTLPAGYQLYADNCAQCHNVGGSGGALGYGDIVPSLRNASALDVVEAARIGPAPMPVFNPSTLSEQQISDIADYVEYLHHPDDRGGLGLGHVGPIPEGFVAWVIGMGALILVTRLIGTRA